MVNPLSQRCGRHRRPGVLLFLTVSMLFLIVGLVACGGSQPSVSSTTNTHTPAVVPTHITINTQSEKTVTLADNNTTINIKSGTTVEVILNNSSSASQVQTHWLVSVSRSDVLIPWTNAPMPVNAQGIFNAGKAGTAQISATGQSGCSTNTANCKQTSQTFQVQVNVQ